MDSTPLLRARPAAGPVSSLSTLHRESRSSGLVNRHPLGGVTDVDQDPLQQAVHRRQGAVLHRPGGRPTGTSAGDGQFTQRCCRLLEERFGIPKVLLTPSCTAALEMAAMLCDLGPGDEVILPSFTFVSTANARRPARGPAGLRRHPPRHAEHRRAPDRARRSPTGPRRSSRSTTPGSACEMDRIMSIAAEVRPASRRGRRAGGQRVLQRPGPGLDRPPRDATASTRPRTTSAARAARCASTTRR